MVRITGFRVLSIFIVLSLVSGYGMSDAKKTKERFVTEPEINLEVEFIKLKAEFEAFKNKSQGRG